MLYAVGQGALAVECRVNDAFVLKLLSRLCDFKTQCRILTERSFLKTLGGGCSAPVGINSVITETLNSSNNEYTLNAEGGVWSLDGQSEIVDKVSTEFLLKADFGKREIDEDLDDLDVSPNKRQKLSEEEMEKLKRSPEIIDESSCSTKGDKNASEIVNIHGRVFDVCPFSGQSRSSKNESQSNNGDGRRFDPLTLPIGQDFMGECPVLNIAEKISFGAASDGAGDSLGCPMVGKVVKSSNSTEKDIEKCPFLHKQNDEIVELIDYEANAKINPCSDKKSLVDNLDDVKLYCGFFCHELALRSTFDKCEALGVSLADKLIAAGALEIMKKAQDEIHSKC